MLLAALLLASAAGAAPHRYLALGDSFTAGTGASRAQSFPVRLAARWKKAGVEVQLSNPATNGFTTDDLIESELPELARFKPTIVSVAIGANDIVRGSDEVRYRRQLKIIFKAIAVAQVKTVFALPQPAWSESPVGEMFGDRAALRRQIERFNTILREEAAAVGARYIDLWPHMLQNAAKLSPDGLHPSAEAYDAWAAELEKQIKLK